MLGLFLPFLALCDYHYRYVPSLFRPFLSIWGTHHCGGWIFHLFVGNAAAYMHSIRDYIDLIVVADAWVYPLDDGLHYNTPFALNTSATPCRCNTVIYSTISACATCQGQFNFVPSWKTYSTNCTRPTIGRQVMLLRLSQVSTDPLPVTRRPSLLTRRCQHGRSSMSL